MTEINLEQIAITVKKLNPGCRDPKEVAKRYVERVTTHIVDGMARSNSDQLILGFFPIALDKLRVECKKFKPGNQYYFKLLHEAHPLFTIQQIGSNLKGKQTVANTDIPLSILLAGNDKSAIVKKLYKDIDPLNPPEIEFAEIDIQNLKNYINRMSTYKTSKTIEKNITEAVIIKIIAEETDGCLPMVVYESAFGRKYYRGRNLQSCSKEVRHAALGSCWSIDISNSVFNWRYSEADKSLQKLLPNTRTYLLDKDRIRKKLAHATFGNTAKYTIDTVKRVMTAISFGARGETNCWYKNELGHWVQGSISEIIKSPDLRKELFAFNDMEFSMPQFMHEQELINTYLVKTKFKDLIKDPEIRKICLTDSGKRISEKKFLALMYQQAERRIMEQVNTWANAKRLLLVHDGAYYATKPDIASMGSELQRFWPLAKFDLTQVEPWSYVLNETDINELKTHEDLINQQECEANGGVNPTTTGIHTETLAVKIYDTHCEPDWETLMMREYEMQAAPFYQSDIQEIINRSKGHA